MTALLSDLTTQLIEARKARRDTSHIVSQIADALPSKHDAEREAAAIEQAAVDTMLARHAAIRQVYDQLFDPAHYAGIEGDGGREDAYCDSVWDQAEAIVATNHTVVCLGHPA